MSKALGITVAALVVLVGLGFGGRAYASRAMSTRALTPKSLGAKTPAVAGLPYSRVVVASGDRTIVGWWVRANADSGKVAPAVLLLHGNHASISDFISFQSFLYRQGISSWVFDYSGFGASGGDASLQNAEADAAAVAKVFADTVGKGARKVAFGSALGATVLLQAVDSVQPFVDGIIIEGVTASVKESGVRTGRIPSYLAPLVPDVGDNVAAASRVHVPLLAVHSYADNRFPLEDARRVVAAVPANYSLIRHWRKGHAAILNSSKPCDWAPILAFVRSGALPTAKMDTTDSCVLEQMAQRARRDSAATMKRVQLAGRPARTVTRRAAPARGSSAKTKAAASTKNPLPSSRIAPVKKP
jgi:hypothetical protein